jgi:hypothetical protein
MTMLGRAAFVPAAVNDNRQAIGTKQHEREREKSMNYLRFDCANSATKREHRKYLSNRQGQHEAGGANIDKHAK